MRMDAQALSVREVIGVAFVAIRARWWLVGVVLLACVGALVLNGTTAKSEARLTVAFNPGNVIQSVFNEPRQGVPAPTAAELRTDEVLVTLGKRVGSTPEDLRGRLRVEQVEGDERQATLIAAAPDAKSATNLVNEWAAAYIEYRRKVLGDALFAARREIRERADKLLRDASQFQRAEILRSVLAVRAAAFDPIDVQRVSFDGVSTSGFPLALGVLLGLGAGVGAALLVALLDGRIRTSAQVEAQTALSVVAKMPGGVNELRNSLFRTVGTSSPRLTLLAGVSSPDNTSAVGLELARSMADGRRTALMVDATVGVLATQDDADGLAAFETMPFDDGIAVLRPKGGGALLPEAWRAAINGLLDDYEAVVVASQGVDAASWLAAAPIADVSLYVVVAGATRSADVRAASGVRDGAGRPTGFVIADRRWVRQRAPTARIQQVDPEPKPQPVVR